ncbi:MAG: hypothetical protein LQ347_004078 [Umbilicaria vellea]|nr:MAG: hypothetical protein LQ347_004078 [Umbilicaria vellea]
MEEAESDGTQRVEGYNGTVSGQDNGIGATSQGQAANQSVEERSILQKLAHEVQEVTSDAGQTDIPPRHESLTPLGDMPIANAMNLEDGEGRTETTTVTEQRTGLDTIVSPGGPNTQAHDDGIQTVSGLLNYEDYGTSPFTQDYAPSLPILPNGTPMTDSLFSEAANSVVESEAPRIQAFAKLEFDDGQFYMNTYSVELGRDIRAARLASQWDLGSPQEPDAKTKKRSTSSGDASQTSIRIKKEDSRKMAGSVVSESGGIMGVDVQNPEPRRRTKGKKSKSTDSSQYLSRRSSGVFPAVQTDYQSLAMASLADSTFGAHPVDPLSLLPSPDECPLIPIHPPVVPEGVPAGHRGISRKHVRIAFNFEKHLFEIEINGKNGAFVDEQWHAKGERQPLRSGSYIQIGGVGVRFVLPDVALGETGAEGAVESNPAAGGKMSFDFEDGRGEDIGMADSSEVDSGDDDEATPDDSGEEHDNPDEDEEEEGEEQEPDVEGMAADNTDQVGRAASEEGGSEQSLQEETIEPPVKEEPKPEIVLPPPKRKGPGRPPKNGIISKREQALLARQAKEAAKKDVEAKASGKSLPGKGKSAKVKTGEQEVSSTQPKPEKRKYTKRKPKVEASQEGQTDIRETKEPGQSIPTDQASEAVATLKPPKEKKPPKPPRSPSPVFDESTMTPEQLAKPQSSYVVLIHEALSNSKIGAMSLPQIYRAIERRYPFYKLRVQTTGWQSSVRHNLSQHPAFRKVERDGKGWMWGLVPEVSIEKEKKRRPSPPPLPPQGYYPQNNQMPRYPYPHSGQQPLLPPGHVPPHYGTYPAASSTVRYVQHPRDEAERIPNP